MGRLKKILQIREVNEKLKELRNYAYEEGLSSPEIVEGQAKLIEKIASFERHKTTVIVTSIGAAVAGAWLFWNIIYAFFIYPPKYTLDGTTLHFEKWFGGWVEQTREKNPEANIYQHSAEFELHLILQNKNRGEGEISKPILIITAENSEKEFQVLPESQYLTSSREGNVTSYHTVDLGRTIKVGSYGIVDDSFEYSIRDSNRGQKELMDFLRENRNRLKFRIKGIPYGEIEVKLIEDYRS